MKGIYIKKQLCLGNDRFKKRQRGKEKIPTEELFLIYIPLILCTKEIV